MVNYHFNDGSLDPAWSISFTNATGWTYSESGTNLTVTDIISTITNKDWSKVTLSRSFTPLSDFHVDFDIGWDSNSSNAAMQYLYVYLLTGTGTSIAIAGYSDAWVGSPGEKRAFIGSGVYDNPNKLPFSGTASIDIWRTNGNIDVYWDGAKLLSGVNLSLLSKIEIGFGYYQYVAPNVETSFFGSESVDLMRVESTPIPEPCTIFLFGSGLIGLAALRRKFKK